MSDFRDHENLRFLNDYLREAEGAKRLQIDKLESSISVPEALTAIICRNGSLTVVNHSLCDHSGMSVERFVHEAIDH
jgi:hypothetical protein